jgi:tRNA1Val (adenine37-N6)-methyltransferase
MISFGSRDLNMAEKPFQFKQFSISHERCTHKVGTDGVLLGAWARIPPDATRVLDIGTGSGLIALMIAQRTGADCFIDAIEIGEGDAGQARENVARSPWKDRVTVYHTSLEEFREHKNYDLIVANPPYFSDSLLPPDEKRSRARHTTSLPLAQLVKHTLPLLSAQGRLAIILPWTEGQRFISVASTVGLSVVRRTVVRSRVSKPVERLLLEFALSAQAIPDTALTLHSGKGEKWSEEYIALTRDFYLKT